MSKSLVKTALAPEAIGPFSQANIYHNFIFVSSQNGALPGIGQMPPDFESQAKNAMYNLKAVIEASGSRLERVLSAKIYLTDINQFNQMNLIYGQFFRDDNALPAREVFVVSALPKGALIEVSAVAFMRDDT